MLPGCVCTCMTLQYIQAAETCSTDVGRALNHSLPLQRTHLIDIHLVAHDGNGRGYDAWAFGRHSSAIYEGEQLCNTALLTFYSSCILCLQPGGPTPCLCCTLHCTLVVQSALLRVRVGISCAGKLNSNERDLRV
ncbi:hypothetical protein C8Q77DRAFT_1130831 [Trametes polyzona]|nr:hypothetical protein C8Q77DRAFT_1130831 [Trametes polyzona]